MCAKFPFANVFNVVSIDDVIQLDFEQPGLFESTEHWVSEVRSSITKSHCVPAELFIEYL